MFSSLFSFITLIPKLNTSFLFEPQFIFLVLHSSIFLFFFKDFEFTRFSVNFSSKLFSDILYFFFLKHWLLFSTNSYIWTLHIDTSWLFSILFDNAWRARGWVVFLPSSEFLKFVLAVYSYIFLPWFYLFSCEPVSFIILRWSW